MKTFNGKQPVSAKKKGGAGASRSALLKIIMPQISGDHGDALAKAAEAGNEAEFARLWVKTTESILQAVTEDRNRKAKKVEAGFTDPIDVSELVAELQKLKASNVEFPSRETQRKIRAVLTMIRATENAFGCEASMHPSEVRKLRQQIVSMKRELRADPSNKDLAAKIAELQKQADQGDSDNVQQVQRDTSEWEAEKRKKGY